MKALLLAAALLAAPALAQKPNRTAPLATLDLGTATALATEIAMDRPTADPPPPAFAVTLAPAAAYIVQPVGLSCTGQRVAVNPAPLFARLAPPPERPAATLHIESGRAFRRCVTVAELKQRCLVTVEFEARLDTPGEPARPLAVAVTRDHGAGASCKHIPEGTALTVREAAITLLAAASAPPSPQARGSTGR